MRRIVGRIESAEVARFGRSGLSVIYRTPVVVLETTGRRTGAVRRTTVSYHSLDAERIVVVGGAAGQKTVPDWVANLRAEPSVTVIRDRRRAPMVATELHGPERADHWSTLRRIWPRIDRYQAKAGRDVPVFLLTTVAPDP